MDYLGARSGFANLLASTHGGQVVLDFPVTGADVITLDEDDATASQRDHWGGLRVATTMVSRAAARHTTRSESGSELHRCAKRDRSARFCGHMLRIRR